MVARRGVAAVVALPVAGCAGGEEDREADRERRAARADVARTAEAYYDALRERRLDDACGLVADRLLEQRLVVGVNVADRARPDLDEREPPEREGCRAVRQRRRGWAEPLPRAAWRVDCVRFDRTLTRARADTSGEGTYWMRRSADGWRIVGFGALTDAGVRELGGVWDRDPAGE